MDFRKFLAVTVYASLLATSATPAAAVTIDYSNTRGSNISLHPTDGCGAAGSVGCFEFTSNGPTDKNIEITSGAASGVLGRIEGLFGVGTIATPFPGLQTADVSGAGTLSIFRRRIHAYR